MKYIIYITLIVLSINTMNGQVDFGEKEYIITTDPSVVLENGQNTRSFPWNGCQAFDVGVDVWIFDASTTILICCVEGVCFPNPMPRSSSNNQEYCTITSSSTVSINGYKIKIVPGKYNVNRDGQFQNLKFKISQ